MESMGGSVGEVVLRYDVDSIATSDRLLMRVTLAQSQSLRGSKLK